MKDPLPCHAKETGRLSGGRGGRVSVESAPEVEVPVPVEPASPWRSVESAPFGMPIHVRRDKGESVLAVRSCFLPNWQDGNRDKALPFMPDEWCPIDSQTAV